MPDYALSDIVAAADAKYGDLRIADVVTLRNALRLPKEQRRALVKLQERIDTVQTDEDDTALSDTRRAEVRAAKDAILLAEDGEEREDETEATIRLIGEAVVLVADTPERGRDLLTRLGDNLPALLEVFSRYGEVSQPGEASPSAS